jgi:hypothetical protein
MKMKQLLYVFSVSLWIASIVQADTVVEFDNLNYSDGVENEVTANGASDNLIVVRTSEVSGGTDYLYTITYTGADYDGDSINDTLTYTVRVSAMNGNTVVHNVDPIMRGTTGSVTLDGANADVSLYNETDESWAVAGGGTGGMNDGETLIFTVENLSVDVAGYTATFDGFSAVLLLETTSFGHTAVAGVGAGLSAVDFKTDSSFDSTHINDASTLYVSAQNCHSAAWGITGLAYSITVVRDSSDSITVVSDASDSTPVNSKSVILEFMAVCGVGLLFFRKTCAS